MTSDSRSPLAVGFADPVLETAFRQLCRSNAAGKKRLAGMMTAAIRALRDRHREGKTLTGPDIPEYYRNRFGVTMLQTLDLPPHWRVFYIADDSAITILDLTCDGFT